MANTNRLTRRLVNTLVVFHGYDGTDYTAFVTKIRNGVATLTYNVWLTGQKRVVTAYISDAARIATVR